MRDEYLKYQNRNLIPNNTSSHLYNKYNKYNKYKYENRQPKERAYNYLTEKNNNNIQYYYRRKYNTISNNNNPSVKQRINITKIKYDPYQEYLDKEINFLNLKMRCDLINHKLNTIKYYIDDDQNSSFQKLNKSNTNYPMNVNYTYQNYNNNTNKTFDNDNHYLSSIHNEFNNNSCEVDDNINVNLNINKELNNIYNNDNNRSQKLLDKIKKDKYLLNNRNNEEDNIFNNNRNYYSYSNINNINNTRDNYARSYDLGKNNNNNNYIDNLKLMNNMNKKNNYNNNNNYENNDNDKPNNNKNIFNIFMKNEKLNNDVCRTISLSFDKKKDNEEDLKEDFQIENQTNFNYKKNKNLGENEKVAVNEQKNFQNYQKIKNLLDNQRKNSPINVYNQFSIKKNNNNMNKNELNNMIYSKKNKNKQSFDYDDENENEIGFNGDEDNSNSSNNIYKIKKNKFIIDDENNLYIDSEKNSNKDYPNNNINNKDNKKDKSNNKINSNNNSDYINRALLDAKKNGGGTDVKIKRNNYLHLYKNNENDKDLDIKDNNNEKSLNDYRSFDIDHPLNNKNNNDKKDDINDSKKDFDNSHNKDSNIMNYNINDLLKEVDPKNKNKNNHTSYSNSIKQKYKMIKPNLYLYNYQDMVNKDKDKDKEKPKYRNDSERKSQNDLRRCYNKKLENKMKMMDLVETPKAKSIKTDNNIIDDDTLLAFAKLNKSEDNIKLTGNPDNEDIDTLIGRDKEKLMRYDPIRRNIEMIKNIENYKKQGIVFPGIRKERKIIAAPLKYCYKFRNDPQKFYTELLCDSMYEALDFKIIKNKN